MLYTQLFLGQGNTLADLCSVYGVEAVLSEDKTLVSLTNPMTPPTNRPIERECQGLILEAKSRQVVFKAPDAFFCHDSKPGKQVLEVIEWDSAVAMENRGGQSISLYHRGGVWNVGTPTSPDGSAVADGISYRDLVVSTIEAMEFSWDDYHIRLDPALYYSYDLIPHDDAHRLILTSAVDSRTLKEVDIYALHWPKAVRVAIGSIEETPSFAQQDYVGKGWIICDKDFRRVKVDLPTG